MVAGWSDAGTIDLLDWFAELTIYTSSACLIGPKFRRELDQRFARLYHDLEQGTDALAYVDPYADIETFRRRDAARRGLVELVQAIMDRRADAAPATDEDRDLLDVLMSIRDEDGRPKFSTDVVTGMFISMMFAGHHTTSGTAAWTLIELLRHPEVMARVTSELDDLYAHGEEVSYQALRAMPQLESAIKEALRLHPPLILVLRVAKEELEIEGFRIAPGDAGRGQPGRVQPDARGLPRRRRLRARALPRAAGRGPAEPVDVDPLRCRTPPLRGGAVRHDAAEGHLLRAPARLGVRARPAVGDLPQRPLEDGRPAPAALRRALPSAGVRTGRGRGVRIVVDRDLCQGHGVCESEAPEVFSVSKKGVLTVLDESPAEEMRAMVEQAVAFCPTKALRIEED